MVSKVMCHIGCNLCTLPMGKIHTGHEGYTSIDGWRSYTYIGLNLKSDVIRQKMCLLGKPVHTDNVCPPGSVHSTGCGPQSGEL